VVCVVFALRKAYYILDEILIAGELQESNKKTIVRLIAAQVWNGFSLFLSVGLNEMKEKGKRKKRKRCGGVVWFDREESEERHEKLYIFY